MARRHEGNGRSLLAITGIILILSNGGIGAATVQPSQTTPQASPTPSYSNILLIIGDDMGVDLISPYVSYYSGSANEITTSPAPSTDTIAALAAAGVTFTNAWSSPLCSATRAGIYTGLYSAHNGIYGVVGSTGNLDSSYTTIAEALNQVGYESGLFGKWHLGETVTPIAQGWSYFRGSLEGQLEDYYSWTKTSQGYVSAPALGGGTVTRMYSQSSIAGDYATFVNVDDAVAWINGRSAHWMATVAFNAAHTSDLGLQDPPSPECVPSGSTDTDEVLHSIISCMDASISDLLDGISAKLPNTTVIFVGDNGTQGGSFFGANAKNTVYEGGVNVPMIIADGNAYLHGSSGLGTGRVVSPGRTSSAVVQTVDLFKTIAGIAGANGSSGSDSVSLVPILRNTATSARTTAFTMVSNDSGPEASHEAAARWSNYKLRYDYDTDSCELFNLGTDRWENDPLTMDANKSVSCLLGLLIEVNTGWTVNCARICS